MPVDLEAWSLRLTAAGRSGRAKDFPLGNIHWICFTDCCWSWRGVLKFLPPTKLLRMADIFSFCWNDGLVLYDSMLETSFALGVSVFHVCNCQNRYRGGPSTVVAERRVDFCVERHRAHHGAQVTDSKWWITKKKPCPLLVWTCCLPPCPWSLEEEIHLRIQVTDVIFQGLYCTSWWTRSFEHLRHLGCFGGFSSLRLLLGFVVEVHNTVFQVGFFEELAWFSSSVAGSFFLFPQSRVWYKTTKCGATGRGILCRLDQVVVVQIAFRSALSLWDFCKTTPPTFPSCLMDFAKASKAPFASLNWGSEIWGIFRPLLDGFEWRNLEETAIFLTDTQVKLF